MVRIDQLLRFPTTGRGNIAQRYGSESTSSCAFPKSRNKYNKTQPDSSDWVLYLIRQKLFLSALVSLVELVDTTCSIHELNLTGVEWM